MPGPTTSPLRARTRRRARPAAAPDLTGAAAWPTWLGPVAFVLAIAGTSLTLAPVVAVLTGGFDVPSQSPGVTLLGTFVQDAWFIAVAVMLARRFGGGSPAAFGLRPLPARTLLISIAVAAVAFVAFSAAYGALFSVEAEQDTLERLGTGNGGGTLLLVGVLVIVLAPAAEEIFFRGFFYRALRNRFGVASASSMNGLLFGSIHYGGTDTLVLLPVLAVLGVLFCLLYEWTGSLYPAIGLHVVNNALAFGASGDGDPFVGAALAVVGLALCLVLARSRHEPPMRGAA